MTMRNMDNAKFFSLFGLFWISLGWLALILSFLGLFYAPVIAALGILSVSIFVYIALINRVNLKLNEQIIAVIILSLVTVILFSFFTSPSVFTGRDQGSLSNAAIALADQHKPAFSFAAEKEFFKIYGPGTALNFPGFNYDTGGQLVPHFPLGYISWLAIFYSFFGLTGFILANAVAFFIFLISFYSVSRNYLKFPAAFMALLLVTTSFVFSWFFKFTLSENLALALIWFGIAQFLLYLRENDQLHLFGWLSAFGLSIFVRLEALAFLAAIFIILAFRYKSRQSFKNLWNKKIILTGLALLAIFVLSLKVNNAFYVTFAKGFLNSFTPSQEASETFDPLTKLSYLIRVFSVYSLITYLAAGLFSFFYFLKKRKFSLLIPFFILLPSFIYLINPSISADHPWLLRRFVFAVFPTSLLYSVVFLDFFFKKKIYSFTLFSLLLIINLFIFIPYLSLKENEKLLPQVEKLSTDFEKNDLVLIDRLATGDGWSMMSGPMNLLYQKQAVYFFNPEDIAKIGLTQFDHVYFIIPDSSLNLYEKNGLINHLVPVKDYHLENSFIVSSENDSNYQAPVSLPSYQRVEVYGKIYQYEF